MFVLQIVLFVASTIYICKPFNLHSACNQAGYSCGRNANPHRYRRFRLQARPDIWSVIVDRETGAPVDLLSPLDKARKEQLKKMRKQQQLSKKNKPKRIQKDIFDTFFHLQGQVKSSTVRKFRQRGKGWFKAINACIHRPDNNGILGGTVIGLNPSKDKCTAEHRFNDLEEKWFFLKRDKRHQL